MRVKNKTKGVTLSVLAILFIGVVVLLFGLLGSGGATTASGDSITNLYNIYFDYSYYRGIYESSCTNLYESETHVLSSKELQADEVLRKHSISFQVYGEYYNSHTMVLENDDYLCSNIVTLKTNSMYDRDRFEVTNSAGTVVGTSASGNTYKLSGLSDGIYFVTYTGVSEWKEETNIRDHPRAVKIVCTFQFQVDTSAPTISGASTSTTGKYVNDTFTVTASDSASGAKTVYMKSPNNSTFYSTGSTKATVSKGSANGLYTFYAEDKSGNKSGYYYVNFDDTPPTMTCTGASFGANTNASFIVTADDNLGNTTLYIKIDSGDWIANSSGFAVTNTADDAKYYFYAEDACGNRTSEMWVEFGAELSGEFIKSDTDNSVYFTWDRPSWTATLDGAAYTKGTWIRTEGEHTIKLSSKTKSAVYPYTIDHYYIESVEKPTCTTEGYLQYDCIQCGNTYTNYSIEETGHYYVASTTVATCTSGGYTIYTCTRCGDNYTDNYTNPLGHNYEATYYPATCTDFGKTVFTCQVCGSGYHETDGTYPTGHNYNNTVVTAPTCTTDGLRRSTCESCGHTFDTKISANGHNYNITESSSAKGKVTRTYTCTVCHHSYKQELGDQYEEVTNYVEYLFEQYEPYMWWVLLASAGVWSIVIGVMIAIAHKNEEKEKAKKMIINYVIGLVVIAVIVVACPFLIRGIAALVT